ncbi:hypothetical protein NSMM_70007 [Nitrosomonas mobilis]|uniref:Uncharacterized protein n=1 Tax=Nitrosomonas mobilis TaxID=51642 RepID=A0A1G5SIA9_9PROT|nr:hypothetical protein NSMM_70007 [Nitrosomonas mobilis]
MTAEFDKGYVCIKRWNYLFVE